MEDNRVQMAPCGSRWLPLGLDGFIWVQINLDASQLLYDSLYNSYGSQWVHMDSFVSIWLLKGPYGSLWVWMAPYRSVWLPVVCITYGHTDSLTYSHLAKTWFSQKHMGGSWQNYMGWLAMDLYGSLWVQMAPYGSWWLHVGSNNSGCLSIVVWLPL